MKSVLELEIDAPQARVAELLPILKTIQSGWTSGKVRAYQRNARDAGIEIPHGAENRRHGFCGDGYRERPAR